MNHDATFDFAGDDEIDPDSLTEIARFTISIDAQVLAGCLEASGIPVFMRSRATPRCARKRASCRWWSPKC